MTKEEVYGIICQVISEHLPQSEKLTPSVAFREKVAADSLAQLTLIVELENKFEIVLDEDFARDLVTLDDLTQAVHAKMTSS